MATIQNLVGQRYGMLTVLAYENREYGHNLWRCQCDCGKISVVRESNLKYGRSTSCGCKHSPKNFLHFTNGTCLELLQYDHLSKANTSGVRGVYYNKRRQKWIAQIMLQRKCYYLGGYSNFDDAVQARKRGEERIAELLRTDRNKTEETL